MKSPPYRRIIFFGAFGVLLLPMLWIILFWPSVFPHKRNAHPFYLEAGPGADLNIKSGSILQTLKTPGGPINVGKRGTIGQRLLDYDAALTQKDWAKAFSFRSPIWAKGVQLDYWTSHFEPGFQINSIFVLSVAPVPVKYNSNEQAKATVFQIMKMAVVQTKDRAPYYSFYLENWIYEDGDWYLAGGAPWDAPSQPVIGLLQ